MAGLMIATIASTCLSAEAVSLEKSDSTVTIIVTVTEKDDGSPINRAHVQINYGVGGIYYKNGFTNEYGKITLEGDFYQGKQICAQLVASKSINHFGNSETLRPYYSLLGKPPVLVPGKTSEISIELKKIFDFNKQKSPATPQFLNVLQLLQQFLKL